MEASTTRLSIPSIVPTTAKTIAQGPVPTLSPSDCMSLDGVPLLPASDSSFKCGTKTTNRTLVESCCNGNAVQDYLGCFMYCSIGSFSGTAMNDMISCLRNNSPSESTVDVEYITFCQGELEGTIQRSGSRRSRSTSLSFIVTLFLLLLFLCDGVRAQSSCTFTIEEESQRIKQGEARRLADAGTLCPESRTCVVDMSGSDRIVGENRTINGEDASGKKYDAFFEVLGQATDPPRLFPASTSFSVQHWGVGRPGSTTYATWAPFSFCVSGTASQCDEVEGRVEACGALFQSDTGLGQRSVPQGVFLRYDVG